MRRVSALAFALAALTMSSGAQAPSVPLAVRQNGVSEGVESRCVGSLRLRRYGQGHTGDGVALSADGTTLAVGAPHEASRARASTATRPTTPSSTPARSTSSRAPADAGRSRRTSRRRTPQTAPSSATIVALSARRQHAGRVGATGKTATPPASTATRRTNSIPQAGAVYVFTRTGATWTQQAYIKASNTGEAGTADSFGEGDQFGFSLALSGDGNTLAVGALDRRQRTRRASTATRPTTLRQAAGAVYVFTRTRRDVVAAGVRQGVEHRRRRLLRLRGRAERRRQHARGRQRSTRTGRAAASTRQADNRATGPAPRTSSRAAARRGRSRPTSRRPISESQDSFGVHVALSDDGDDAARRVARRGLQGDGRERARLRQRLARRRLDGRRLRVRAQRGTLVAAGVHQGVEHGPNDWFGGARGAERRRQHGG